MEHDVKFDEVADQVDHLADNKGYGPDLIPGEIIKAGGTIYKQALYEICADAFTAGYMPTLWRGGRLARIYKRKGDSAVCDNSRGVLLADHSSKVITGLLQTRLKDSYEQYIGEDQQGCAKGRGTMLANLVARTFVEAAMARENSFALLFIDLTKAFDTAIREVLFGWHPSFAGGKVELMKARGLEEQHAVRMAEWMDMTGRTLKNANVPEHVVKLVSSLHDGSWFDIESESGMRTPIRTARGGRQGCRWGAIVFNYIYAKALREARSQLSEAGVVLELPHCVGDAFLGDRGGGSARKKKER